MIAPLGKLSHFSLKHMVGPEEFFMSHKEKGPNCPREQSCPSREKKLCCSREHQCPPERKGLKLIKKQPCPWCDFFI